MTIKKRLGVFGILPYTSDSKVATPFEDAGLRWLFDENAPGSITRYWRDSTGGLVDLSATEVNGFFVVESGELVNAVKGPDRTAAAQAACNYVMGLGINVDSYDGLVFFIGGHAVGAGATSVKTPFQWKPVALLDDRGTHEFMSHEVGHVIGADHPFNFTWPNPVSGLLFGEYGDPYEIMSAMTYGGRPVTAAMTYDPKSGIGKDAKLWTSGPGPSPATVWRYLTDYPNPQPWMRMLPAAAPATAITLSGPSSTTGTRLVAMPFENGGGFYTLEYRPATGWDGALALAPADPAYAPGLVVHKVQDVGNSYFGNTWPRLQRVCYETTIPWPSNGDVDWSNGEFAVRIKSADATSAGVSVLAGKTLPDALSVSPNVSVISGPETRNSGGPISLTLVGPNCGTGIFETAIVDTEQHVSASAAATGFDGPEFVFTVNGVAIGTSSPLPPQWQKTQTGSVVFPANVEVPTDLHSATNQTATLSATYNIHANVLKLVVPAGLGDIKLDIGVRAIEMGTVTSKVSEASQTVEITTRRFELSDEAKRAQQQCEDFLVGKGLQGHRPDEIDPLGPIAGLPDKWSGLRGQKLIDAVIALDRLQDVNARMGREHEERAAAQIGVHTQELRNMAQRLRQR